MADRFGLQQRLPIGGTDHQTSAWWGMWMLIATEASLFAYLLFSYAYLALRSPGKWVPELPKLSISAFGTVILLASSVILWWGERNIRKGKSVRLLLALGATLLMGIVFVALQGMEWHNKPFTLNESAYASTYYVTTGFHMAHVVGGLLVIMVLGLWTAMGKFSEERYAAVSIGALYWHFVDVVWLAVFMTFYVSPYMTS